MALVVFSASSLVMCGADDDGAPGNTEDAGLPGAAIDTGITDGSEGGRATCSDGSAPWVDPGATPPEPDPALANGVHSYFKITVLDTSNAPVGGAHVTTTNQTVYTADNHGVIAYYEPGLMDTSVYFAPTAAGYTFTADAFGNAGVALTPKEGGSGTITMTKTGTPAAVDAGDLASRLAQGHVAGAADCFALRIMDAADGRGIPLVHAVTGDKDDYWSDSLGMIAYCNPDFVGKSVTFTLSSDGYTPSGDAAVSVVTTKGGSKTIAMTRVNVAQRLYRVTGEGIYRDSILLGLKTPRAKPLLNGLVMGQDTPSTNLYQGKIYWIWQDTEKPAYPLGNFDSSGATSLLPGAGGLSPHLGMDATYFVGNDGFSRGMVKTAETGGPIWLGQLVNVTDAQGQTKMYGRYYVARPANASSALAVFNDATSTFDFVADVPADAALPGGRPMLVRGDGATYAYWSNPVRFPATVDGITNFEKYEQFTPYSVKGSDLTSKDPDGKLAYGWHDGTKMLTADGAKAAGIPADQVLDGHVVDVLTGKPVKSAGESAAWVDSRKRFAKIIQEQYGSASFLGETWYIEGDTPVGPWVFARKVVTHDDGYTFYNPDLIPYFTDAGRFLFFNATYTSTYTNLTPTPRYNYNEMMYRLDLEDARLALPVAVYSRAGGDPATKVDLRKSDGALAPAFFAYDRAIEGTVPLAWSGPACGARRLVAGGSATRPLFHALPHGAKSVIATTPLYEYAGANGIFVYSVDPALAGFTRGDAVADVFPSPVTVRVPVDAFLGDLAADAGPDQCVAAKGAGPTAIALDASASKDVAGPIAKYAWTDARSGCVLATGAKVTVMLDEGVHDIRLDVSDAFGNTATGDVIIAIRP